MLGNRPIVDDNSAVTRPRPTPLIATPFIWLAALLLAAGAGEPRAGAADWPNWRGPRNNGSAEAGNYPANWKDPTTLLWKTPLPGVGCSTPVIWNRRIFLTAPCDGHDALLAFDWAGKPLWQAKLGIETKGKHRNESGSNPSPTTDGKAVFVCFRSGNFAAVDLDGKLRWQVGLTELLGQDTLYWSYGSSPVLTQDAAIITRLHHGESWLAAFDKRSGQLRWKVPRNYETPTENDHAYTTPVVLRDGDRETLLVWGAEHVTAHAAADGSLLWSCGGFNAEAKQNWPTVATPVVVGDIALVSFGRSDRRLPQLHGIRMGGSGDVTATHRAWMRDDTGSFVPSAAVFRQRAYVLQDRGELDCVDPPTGKIVWRAKFPHSSANFYASPVIADGVLFAAREDGAVFVAKIEDGFQLLAENSVGEKVIASPVLVAGRVLIRGERHLFCLGSGTAPGAPPAPRPAGSK